MRIELVSEHANPLAAVGGVDAGGQNVHVAALAAGLVRRGHDVVVSTRRDDRRTPQRVHTPDGYVVEHVPAGPPTEVPKDDLLSHMAEMAAHLGRAGRGAARHRARALLDERGGCHVRRRRDRAARSCRRSTRWAR
jgi:hypothetical protein